MIVTPPPLDDPDERVAAMYAEDEAADGVVYSHTRVMAMNPEAHAAFEALIGAIVPSLGLRSYELVTLAAARSIQSPHCLLAHGRKALTAGLMSEQQLIRLARDYRDADLTDAEVVMMAFAERVSRDASAMTDADSEALRSHGFTDDEIVGIALAAGARNYLSRVLLSLAVPVDDVPGLSSDARSALLEPALPAPREAGC